MNYSVIVKKGLTLLFCLFFIFSLSAGNKATGITLTLIPPTTITNKVNLDVRAGILNTDSIKKHLQVTFYCNHESSGSVLYETSIEIAPNSSECVKFVMPTKDKVGINKIILVVKSGNQTERTQKQIEIVQSGIRSTQTIDGAWIGLYHWSDIEGKNWNPAIKKITDKQWKEVVRSMNELGMNIIVVQELFRNQEYVGKHSISTDGYKGKAFYPSKLYKERMPIEAKDAVEAILSEADKKGMHVFLGVGLYAWFDFTPASLEWHKKIAKELWDLYGHHDSFYGFYVSEESVGNLDNAEADEQTGQIRKKDIVSFFREFKSYCGQFAPAKPIMLATNSFEITKGQDTYPELLKYLDILCPFGFARMPENDLTGKQAAVLLQNLCNTAGSHLWFDLETFLFNEDTSLYPRPIEQIIGDLTLLDNFEKTICYQYPGVFNNPKMSVRIGELSTIKLFQDYKKYLKKRKLKK